MKEGRLFYVAGVSGAGKNGLLDYARAHLGDTHPVMFAHSYVTREPAAGEFNHVMLSETEFALRRRHGLFVMDWAEQGVNYAIGTEINYWLASGLSVVVDGSGSHLDRALKTYPRMTVIWVTTGSDGAPVLPAPPVAVRRAPASVGGCRLVRISGAGAVPLAGARLVSVLVGDGA